MTNNYSSSETESEFCSSIVNDNDKPLTPYRAQLNLTLLCNSPGIEIAEYNSPPYTAASSSHESRYSSRKSSCASRDTSRDSSRDSSLSKSIRQHDDCEKSLTTVKRAIDPSSSYDEEFEHVVLPKKKGRPLLNGKKGFLFDIPSNFMFSLSYLSFLYLCIKRKKIGYAIFNNNKTYSKSGS